MGRVRHMGRTTAEVGCGYGYKYGYAGTGTNKVQVRVRGQVGVQVGSDGCR